MAELADFDEQAALDCLGENEAMSAVDELAQQIAAAASANTPRGKTGAAEGSISSTTATLDEGVATAIVYSDDPFWHLIEYGSVKNDVYRPISRAAGDLAVFEDAL